MDRESRLAQLAEVVNRIPEGRAASYGAVGIAMKNPTSGRIVGQMLAASSPVESLPWWRVVNSKGELSIARRDPRLAQLQAKLLSEDGITLDAENRVPKSFLVSPGDLMD